VANVATNREVTAIDVERRLISLGAQSVRYGALINTAPLPAFLGLVRRLPDELERARARLRATPLYYLDVALETACGKDFHWAYVPERKYPFYRVGCYSHFSPLMAPAGKANLYVELASRTAPQLDELLPEVVAGLIEMGLIARPGDVRFARLRKLDPAYVIYDAEREGALALIEPFLREHGLISTGRYGAWNYSSMEDALLFGRSAAAEAAATSSTT
jgi:protoporphyrinogen oxidase